MRLLLSVALVLSMSGSEIERAQKVARGRDAEREQFHRRYLITLADATVTQVEVITEFRRLVLITEDHIRRGDWLFSQSVRSGEEALAPSRGVLTITAQLRFSPLNTYVQPPAFTLATGAPSPGSPLSPIDTQVSGQYSTPFKARDGKMLSSLIGAVLQANVAASRAGQTTLAVGVLLEGRELARTSVDFARLD